MRVWLPRLTNAVRLLVGDMEAGVYQAGSERCKKLAAKGLQAKAQELLALISEDPYKKPPSFEKLVGDLAGRCSCRINIQHRLVISGVGR